MANTRSIGGIIIPPSEYSNRYLVIDEGRGLVEEKEAKEKAEKARPENCINPIQRGYARYSPVMTTEIEELVDEWIGKSRSSLLRSLIPKSLLV